MHNIYRVKNVFKPVTVEEVAKPMIKKIDSSVNQSLS